MQIKNFGVDMSEETIQRLESKGIDPFLYAIGCAVNAIDSQNRNTSDKIKSNQITLCAPNYAGLERRSSKR